MKDQKLAPHIVEISKKVCDALIQSDKNYQAVGKDWDVLVKGLDELMEERLYIAELMILLRNHEKVKETLVKKHQEEFERVYEQKYQKYWEDRQAKNH